MSRWACLRVLVQLFLQLPGTCSAPGLQVTDSSGALLFPSVPPPSISVRAGSLTLPHLQEPHFVPQLCPPLPQSTPCLSPFRHVPLVTVDFAMAVSCTGLRLLRTSVQTPE